MIERRFMKIIQARKNTETIGVAKEMASSFGISLYAAKLLVLRGVSTLDEAKEFLHTNISSLISPLLLKDMDAAVGVIKTHIENKSTICILGDYDADGVTSTALLYMVLKELGAQVSYYIPSRQTEGYGLTMPALENVMKFKPDLLITVDCGVTSLDEVKELYARGVSVIITDHHKCPELLPECEAVINPNRLDCSYPFKGLAGVGVAAKLSEALTSREQMLKYADLIALGTIADLMPLLSENRVYVTEGLALINKSCNLGIEKLIEVSGLKKEKISARDVAFMIAPRVNAGGRMDNNDKSVELLITDDSDKALSIAENLNGDNIARQQLVSSIQKNALGKLEAKSNIYNDYAIIIADSTYNHSVLGIVASKLVEKYYRPAIVLAEQEGMLTGSARSIPGIDIHKALSCCSDLYERFGGHAQAAGLTLKAEHYGEFVRRINAYLMDNSTTVDYVPKVMYDLELSIKDIDTTLINELNLLEPCGMANPRPDFYINASIKEVRKIGANNSHLKFVAQVNEKLLDGVAFSQGYLADTIQKGQKVDIVCKAEINEWNGMKKAQINASYIGGNTIYNREAIKALSFRFYDAMLDNILYNYSVGEKKQDCSIITSDGVLSLFKQSAWGNVIFCGTLESAEYLKNEVFKEYTYYDEYTGYIKNTEIVYNSIVYAPLLQNMQDVEFNNAIFVDCIPCKINAQKTYILEGFERKIVNINRDSLLNCYAAIKSSDNMKIHSSYEQICDGISNDENKIDMELLCVSIRIFKELKLIEIDEQPLCIRIKTDAKADLHSSMLYKAINNI